MARPRKQPAPDPAPAAPILVEALRRGIYGQMRERGDRFLIKRESDLGRWMRRVDGA